MSQKNIYNIDKKEFGTQFLFFILLLYRYVSGYISFFSILYIFFWLTTCTAIFNRRCNAWCYEMETRVQRIQKNINSYKPGVPKLKIKKPNTIELFSCEVRFPSKLLTNHTTLLRRKKHFFKKTPTPCSKILLLRTLSSRVLRLAPKVFKERYDTLSRTYNVFG